MRKIVRIDEKKVLLDTQKDEIIYDAHAAAWKRTGTDRGATRGIDLYVHKCKDGTLVFYKYHWTRWQGEANYIEAITKDEAEQFVEENFDVFTEDEDIEQLKRLGLYPEELY